MGPEKQKNKILKNKKQIHSDALMRPWPDNTSHVNTNENNDVIDALLSYYQL